ncbi:hypothetical protein E1J38_006485 [Seonamhaeicola sediminis]|uniref:Lipocalin-like domain-containing protein n=1 Tax=Seonamhaeicola sediminis TaxID=2528206 RepID=A0A562YCV3_9FLAO|nr:hypothetical protein [Seonamhaeicola sediminis]TWO32517.1 hypothetical protein E1J38_006485 [Seonamhaeicola sediminis]
MKTNWRILLLLPFFALLMFTSCQEEVVDITEPTEAEALVAESELTALVSAASKMDGSKDNIIDRASCISVKLPLTVVANGLEIIIDSEEDFEVIEAIFDEFDNDDDNLEMIFPITIINADHDEIVINNADQLEAYAEACSGENEEDDDIECIDFKYPISFSIFNADFLIIDTIEIENDRQLHRFIRRVKENEVIASINYPVTMVLADGSEIIVNSNQELHRTIKEAKDACDEDDDNDYNDDDFTKERLDNYLVKCPWLVHEFNRDANALTDKYFDYAINFKENGVVVMRARNGDMLTGTWETRVVQGRGAKLKMEFENLADFTLEWYIYEIEEGRVKVYQEDAGRIIMKRNCDVVIDHTKERVKNYLQECLWRIARINVGGAENEKEYIGTPLRFFENNVVKIRIEGELVEGTYEVFVLNSGRIGLSIELEGRPNLKLQWLVSFLGPNLIKLENSQNRMVLERHCPNTDNDLNYIEDILVSSQWEVASYMDNDADLTENFFMYTLSFLETGRIKITDPNEGVTRGSWLAYRHEGLFLGMRFGRDNEPFNQLTHRWRIKEITPNRIELKDYSANGIVERVLVLERKE